MIENEFKIMLTADQYERICEEFSWDETIFQTNYYFDTEGLELSERRITARVREINGEFFLQMKMPTNKDFSRIELEQRLEDLPEEISGETLSRLSGCAGLPNVKRLGKLFTKRLAKRFSGAEIDLDLSEYFDKRDYEIEIEFTDEKNARELLKKIRAIIGESSAGEVCTGKLRRFLNEYRKQK